jgi:hypothetical protein
MADITSSSVVVNRSSSQTLSSGLILWSKACTVTLTGQGTTTNKILATAFGLSSFEETSSWVKTDNTEVVQAGPSNDRTLILLADPDDAAAANHITPADRTGAYNCVVKGY